MEYIGIFAGIMVLVSFIPVDIKKIRLLNIIGCVLFVIYGIGINSISIWLTNGVLGIIHIYKIRNIKRR
jgi:hypothetical protein